MPQPHTLTLFDDQGGGELTDQVVTGASVSESNPGEEDGKAGGKRTVDAMTEVTSREGKSYSP
jgi:hypothetical protein